MSLSIIATEFASRIKPSLHRKYGSSYENSFTGKEAVDLLCRIIDSSNRNLALVLGRALDKQSVIVDVTKNHRLRDSANEIYVLSDIIPNGVFIAATSCYSPTCTKNGCYAYACPFVARVSKFTLSSDNLREEVIMPRRDTTWTQSVPFSVFDSLSQMEIKRQESIFEFIQGEYNYNQDLDALNQHIIKPLLESSEFHDAKQILSSLCLASLMKIMTDHISILAKKLKRKQAEAPNFVFDQIGQDLISYYGSPYLLTLCAEYAEGFVYAQDFLALERKRNSPTVIWIDNTGMRNPVFRKLPLESYIGSSSRLTKSKLQIETILKHTPLNHPDYVSLPHAIRLEGLILQKINDVSGAALNRLKIYNLQQDLDPVLNERDRNDIRLGEPHRLIIRDGKLLMKRTQGESEHHLVLLDNVMLIYRKKGDLLKLKAAIPLALISLSTERSTKRLTQAGQQVPSRHGSMSNNSSTFTDAIKRKSMDFYGAGRRSRTGSIVESAPPMSSSPDPKTSQSSAVHLAASGSSMHIQNSTAAAEKIYPLNILHIGRSNNGLENVIYQFSCPNESERRGWQEAIESQVEAPTTQKFAVEILSDLCFNLRQEHSRVSCTVSHGDKLLVGTENGLYMRCDNVTTSDFVKILSLERITQIELLSQFNIMLVLSDKALYSFPLHILDEAPQNDQDLHGQSLQKEKWIGKKIGTSISFFKSGICLDKFLVCAVKSTSLSSTIKVFEPIQHSSTRKISGLAKFLKNVNNKEMMKVFKEFYIPTESNSIIFLKTKLCVGCTKGFEIVDLDTLNTQGLLDPSDTQLNFVMKDNMRPISLFRVKDGDFLLCYDQFGFYVDKLGRRSRPTFVMSWSGYPFAFSLEEPFVIAYSYSFIEVRDIFTGELLQIIKTNKLRVTNDQLQHCVLDGSNDFQHIIKLKVMNDEVV